jgi:hypothetical protein
LVLARLWCFTTRFKPTMETLTFTQFFLTAMHYGLPLTTIFLLAILFYLQGPFCFAKKHSHEYKPFVLECHACPAVELIGV